MSFLPLSNFENTEQWRVYNKIAWRLMPFLLLLYIISFLDRVNVGFAKLQMSADIGLSDAAYGIGAGIFFLGYCLCEIPSNLLLQRFGAKFWIARIMVVWGIISTAMLFVQTPWQFYGMRFLLGIAEAGFYPGIILYLTYWYPARLRSQICAIFFLGIALSGVIGGPLSGWIMNTFGGLYGLHGWQWLFLLEGAPAIIFGVVSYFYLDDGPAQAKWLAAGEKSLVVSELEDGEPAQACRWRRAQVQSCHQRRERLALGFRQLRAALRRLRRVLLDAADHQGSRCPRLPDERHCHLRSLCRGLCRHDPHRQALGSHRRTQMAHGGLRGAGGHRVGVEWRLRAAAHHLIARPVACHDRGAGRVGRHVGAAGDRSLPVPRPPPASP